MALGPVLDDEREDRAHRPWWETRPFVAAVILLSMVPLLYPPIPPLVDLFGHMGRYRVQLDLHNSPWLSQYYGFHWAAIGNLGVDLLVMPLGRLIGLEPAVKLIVLAIPPMTVAGFLWVAREVHHRLPPTALFALPFAYSHPFMFGFVNFALSVALAFLAFGLWLRLGRLGKLRLRAMLFVPISIVVFFAHTFGWGMLGLLCFSAEAVRQHDEGRSWWRSGINAALHASVMALPLFIMLAWRSEAHGGMTRGWFDWDYKWTYIKQALRDRWKWFDLASVAAVGLVLLTAIAVRRLTFSRNLLFTAMVLTVGFVILPRTVFGSTYADMRLLPYVLATAVLAIRFHGPTHLPLARVLAILGLGFYAIRLGGTTVSMALAANDQKAELEALDHVPMGARVGWITDELSCGHGWRLPTNSHLGAMVIVRRHGFSNDQWVIEGLNLLDLKYRAAGKFASDPSQITRPSWCRGRGGWFVNAALYQFPRDKFDYLWMIDPPPFNPVYVEGLTPVWRNGRSILYRLD
ncbi:hypothetical protein H9L13_00955 [Sphingomonas lutea]|uniref:Uncharacterized protein n=1 Tax=Sphingomonas lutea TaxID=1045317 RepID=A0A7G9SI90_9SPHN|nr:hypothetical protein [Sphingomonas lutea]QNN67565.1 hypothetical protein H9L13_00955 [Sphingomonas lutea]